MHGTGTPLGDPIEVGAAAAVLVEGPPGSSRQGPLMLASSKSWCGHAEPAAGERQNALLSIGRQAIRAMICDMPTPHMLGPAT